MTDTNSKLPQKILEQIDCANNLYRQKIYGEALELLNYLQTQVSEEFPNEKSRINNLLGNIYYAKNDYDNAIIAYEEVIKYSQDYADVYNMLGFLYFYKNNDKSIEYYLKYMEFMPKIDTFTMLTQIMIKSAMYSQKDLKNTFEKYIDIFRKDILKELPQYSYNPKDYNENKKLKIGYLSSDFYCHAMMSFVLPFLENHDKNKFEITLFYGKDKSDSVTERLKQTGAKLIDCSTLSNTELAKTIHNEKIDILVDLGGYTHKLVYSLIYKPAPVIVQYLGFLGTYGIKEVDYILADEFTIPKDIAPYYTEKPMYIESGMNRFTFPSPNTVIPDLKPLPYEENKYLTFGSFNCMSKINPFTINLWSKVLKAVPDSKLLIYRTQLQQRDIDRITKQFEKNEIPAERIIFDNTQTPVNHFNAYSKCDIALDTSPFSGLTITIEQAFMGVPVLTVPKETISSKGAARVNLAIGLEYFVAKNENEYVQKAYEISQNIDKLRWYRQNLRKIVTFSPLLNDYKTFASQIETEYIKAWKNFCRK